MIYLPRNFGLTQTKIVFQQYKGLLRKMKNPGREQCELCLGSGLVQFPWRQTDLPVACPFGCEGND